MMPSPPPSSNHTSSAQPGLSPMVLWTETLKMLRRICGDQWSDVNSHDLGNTIQEPLNFAPTELAHCKNRTSVDLPASARPDWQSVAAEMLQDDPVMRDERIATAKTARVEDQASHQVPLNAPAIQQVGLGGDTTSQMDTQVNLMGRSQIGVKYTLGEVDTDSSMALKACTKRTWPLLPWWKCCEPPVQTSSRSPPIRFVKTSASVLCRLGIGNLCNGRDALVACPQPLAPPFFLQLHHVQSHHEKPPGAALPLRAQRNPQ